MGEDFTPDPVSLLESSRNLGYSIEEAISDLIDNSITAGADNIEILAYEKNDTELGIILADNGKGMTEETVDTASLVEVPMHGFVPPRALLAVALAANF